MKCKQLRDVDGDNEQEGGAAMAYVRSVSYGRCPMNKKEENKKNVTVVDKICSGDWAYQ